MTKFKVGDKVRVKCIKGETKSNRNMLAFTTSMTYYHDRVATITDTYLAGSEVRYKLDIEAEDNSYVAEWLESVNGVKTLDDLDNGHIVKFDDDTYGLVFKGFMTWSYIMNGTTRKLSFNSKNGGAKLLEDTNIVEVRSIKTACNDSFLVDLEIAFGIMEKYVVWKKEVVKEMTMAQLEEELGYKVKVVK